MATKVDQIPVRAGMDDPATKWATAKPNYKLVNDKYMAEKKNNNQPGSTAKMIENLIKTWEMEANHKVDPAQWVSITPDVKLTVNGHTFSPEEMKLGAYNLFLFLCPLHDPYKYSSAESMKMFKTAFPGGFVWEVLEAYSDPPKVSFEWRHWAEWEGPYGDIEPTGEHLELSGMAVSEINDEGKMTSINISYDPSPFMVRLLRLDDANYAKQTCPFHKNNN